MSPLRVDDVVQLVRDTTGPLRAEGAGGLLARLGPLDPDATAVSTAELSGILELAPADEHVTVLAGTRVADLADALAPKGIECALDPWWPDATVGGAVAAGLSGYRRLGHGPVRDQVLQLRMVLGTGEVVTAGGRVVKNVTGYDVCRLVAGSLGRYGAILEVTLRTRPRAEASTWFAGGRSAPGAASAHLRTAGGDLFLLEGRPAEVAAWAARSGTEAADPSRVAAAQTVLRRPAARAALAPEAADSVVERLPPGLDWVLEPLFGILHLGGGGAAAAGSAGLDAAERAVAAAGGRLLRYGADRAALFRATAPEDPGVDGAVAAAVDPSRRFDWRTRP